MSDSKLNALADHAAGVATLIMQSGEQVDTMLVAETADDQPVFCPLPFPPETPDAVKDAVMAKIAERLKAVGTARYIVCSEAWMVTASRDEELDLSIAPSKSPRRQEVLIIVGENVDGEHIYRLYQINRTDGASLTELPTLGDSCDSRFLGLIAQHRQNAPSSATVN